jgi:hypothetical protein
MYSYLQVRVKFLNLGLKIIKVISPYKLPPLPPNPSVGGCGGKVKDEIPEQVRDDNKLQIPP